MRAAACGSTLASSPWTRGPTRARGLRVDIRAQSGSASRQVRDSVRKRVKVHHGAADQQRMPAAPPDVLHDMLRVRRNSPTE